MDNELERVKVLDLIQTFFEPNREKSLKDVIIHSISSYDPEKDIALQLKKLGLMLAGGAINNIFSDATVNDLDFYIKDHAKIREATAFLLKWFPNPPFYSRNAITFSRKSTRSNRVWRVQLITRFVGDPEYVLDTFDFTITQGLYDFENEVFVFGNRFFQDLAKKKLVYLGKSHYPICAMYRTKKYQNRGYKLPGSTIMHIALSIVRLEIKTYKDLKEQLMGIDTMYLQNLLNTEAYDDALPVDFGKFMVDAFERINGVALNDESDTDE